MREDEVYVGTKIWFSKNGFDSLAGQPPNGSDNLPTIEIKSATNFSKGSKGSFKPDLVFANNDFLILVECKPVDDRLDELKLLEVIFSIDRQRLLYNELYQRGIFKRKRLSDSYPNSQILASKLRLCLAHGGEPRLMNKVATLSLTSIKGVGTISQPIDSEYKLTY